jgi:hypothetical protein
MGKAFLRVFQEVRKKYTRSIFRPGRRSFFFFFKNLFETRHRSQIIVGGSPLWLRYLPGS